MSKMHKTRVRVQPIYSMVMWLVLVLVFIAFLIFPSFIWEYQQFKTELWYFIMSGCLAICLISLINYMQIAVIDENGVTIKNLFRVIVRLNWSKIFRIEEKSISTHESRGIPVIHYNWFVILLSKHDMSKIKRGGINRKNKAPWFIIANNKNREIVEKFYSASTGKTIGY